MPYEVRFDTLLVSDDCGLLDFDVIRGFLATCAWSEGISMAQVERQVGNSTLAFGMYDVQADGSLQQVGFGRVLSDLTRFAYLSDFFILPELQRRGLGQLLLSAIRGHPELVDVRRWLLLATEAGMGLYAKCGFEVVTSTHWMQIKQREPGRWV